MSKLHALLQQTIENLYRIEGPVAVSDFCIRRGHLDAILGSNTVRREALLVREDGEHTDLALYVDDELLDAAEDFLSRPEEAAARARIDAFCVVLEGVSHFLYFTYCGAALERPVSQIELELQAELDKYLLLRVMFDVPGLVDRLFVRFEIDERVPAPERERYRVASSEARRYARWAERQFARGHGARALADARSLYRKPLPAKLEHIARAA